MRGKIEKEQKRVAPEGYVAGTQHKNNGMIRPGPNNIKTANRSVPKTNNPKAM